MAKFKILHGKYRDDKGNIKTVGDVIELTEAAAKNFADMVEEVVEKAVETVVKKVEAVVPAVKPAAPAQKPAAPAQKTAETDKTEEA